MGGHEVERVGELTYQKLRGDTCQQQVRGQCGGARSGDTTLDQVQFYCATKVRIAMPPTVTLIEVEANDGVAALTGLGVEIQDQSAQEQGVTTGPVGQLTRGMTVPLQRVDQLISQFLRGWVDQ